MDEEKYERSISLACPTCGCRDFEYDPEIDDGPISCTRCERVFSRDELIEANGELIEGEVEEMKEEVFRDITRDFEDSMRRAFRGSKTITFR